MPAMSSEMQLLLVGIVALFARDFFFAAKSTSAGLPLAVAAIETLKTKIAETKAEIDALKVALDKLKADVAEALGLSSRLDAIAERGKGYELAIANIQKGFDAMREDFHRLTETMIRGEERWNSIAEKLDAHDARTLGTADAVASLQHLIMSGAAVVHAPDAPAQGRQRAPRAPAKRAASKKAVAKKSSVRASSTPARGR